MAIRTGALMAAIACGLVGCGTTELEVEPVFDGTWSVTELTGDSAPIDLADQPIEIEIDTGQAAVRGQTRCQTLFGSYTLSTPEATPSEPSGGDASFTIPSPRASADCRPADRLVHVELVDALESVTQWRREGQTLTLTSPSGSLIVLSGQTRDE